MQQSELAKASDASGPNKNELVSLQEELPFRGHQWLPDISVAQCGGLASHRKASTTLDEARG
jgi:hypothetical protein